MNIMTKCLLWLTNGVIVTHCPECHSTNIVGPTHDTARKLWIAYCKQCDWRQEVTERDQILFFFTTKKSDDPS